MKLRKIISFLLTAALLASVSGTAALAEASITRTDSVTVNADGTIDGYDGHVTLIVDGVEKALIPGTYTGDVVVAVTDEFSVQGSASQEPGGGGPGGRAREHRLQAVLHDGPGDGGPGSGGPGGRPGGHRRPDPAHVYAGGRVLGAGVRRVPGGQYRHAPPVPGHLPGVAGEGPLQPPPEPAAGAAGPGMGAAGQPGGAAVHAAGHRRLRGRGHRGLPGQRRLAAPGKADADDRHRHQRRAGAGRLPSAHRLLHRCGPGL